MRLVDWIAVGIVGLGALSGLRRGLIVTVLSLAGLAAGAAIGARAAPHFLHGGSSSPYTPLIGLGGAIAGALLLQAVASLAGSFARKTLRLLPPIGMLDSIGGLVAGAVLGLAVVWVAGAAALQLPNRIPGLPHLHQQVEQSVILKRLNATVSPRTILRAFARVDPFPEVNGLATPTAPVPAYVLAPAAVVLLRKSVVRVRTTACGLGIEGSGWVARPHLVITAAHVVAGGHGITVNGRIAYPLVVNRHDDVAVLRVPGLQSAPLPAVDPKEGDPVEILGYPENGPFDAQPGRIGLTADVLVSGSLREVTSLRGRVRQGNSGGPAVNARGQVESTIFAAQVGSSGGFGTPALLVKRALASAKGVVSTGGC
jgi:S1-C subfamily serine protease